MEHSLDLASDWYNCNKLVLNASKPDVMTVSNFNYQSLPKLSFQGMSFKQSEKLKYVGVTFD